MALFSRRLFTICMFTAHATFAQRVFSITSYGAVGDGVTLNTRPIAAAFAAAHASFVSTGAPSIVLADGGVFLSGQIVILSGCTLRVTPATTLLASANVSHYPTNEDAWAFLYSSGASDIAIDGGGILDGNFQRYIAGFDPVMDRFTVSPWNAATCNPSGGKESECRPRLCKLSSSTRIVIRDVTFTGSPDWTTHIVNCSFVHIANWTQHGDERWPNNDGLDLDSTSHVLVEDSSLDTADDGICIKGSSGPMTNVTVRRTRVRSRSSAIKFGSNTGPSLMSDMLFEDIVVHDSNRGLAIQARDGGLVANITFRRVLINGTRFWPVGWWGDGSPLYISTMLRTAADPGAQVRNVTFEDIVAHSQAGAVFSGLAPGGRVNGVTLRNVTIVIDRWPAWNYSDSSVPPMGPNIEYDPSTVKRTHTYETGWMSGVYAESVEGLVLDGVNVTFANDRWQSYWGTECVNVTHAGYPVTQRGGACTPPKRPASD